MDDTSKNKRRIIAVLLVIALAAAAGVIMYVNRTRSYATVTFHMDTYVSYDINCPRPERAVRKMEAAVKECEELFDRFDPSSEIAKINRNAGEAVEVSEQTYVLMFNALELAKQTGGSFDPTIGALSDLWGFGDEPRIPDQDDLAECLANVGFHKVTLSRDEKGGYYVCIAKGQKLDLGAIAKGYTLNEVGFAAYKVGVRCPDENSKSSALILRLGDTADDTVLSTSGSYERFFWEDGVRYCHIIDPFTGDCAEKDLKSVTVISTDPVHADGLSTAYYVMGIDRTLDALASGEITGVAIDRYGTIYISEDLMDKVVPGSVAEGYELEVVG